MTIDGEQQTNPDQEAGITDLKSELRETLAKDFKRRLTGSEHISEEQCKRLYDMLVDGSISDINIVVALTEDEGLTADG